jgi:hypothetical protein
MTKLVQSICVTVKYDLHTKQAHRGLVLEYTTTMRLCPTCPESTCQPLHSNQRGFLSQAKSSKIDY